MGKIIREIVDTLWFMVGLADMESEETINCDYEPIGKCPKGYGGSHFASFLLGGIGFYFLGLSFFAWILGPTAGLARVACAISWGFLGGLMTALIYPMVMTAVNWLSYDFRQWIKNKDDRAHKLN